MALPSDRAPLVERVEELLAVGGPLPIVSAGDPVLRHRTEPFEGQLEPALLARFVEALRMTMHAAPGVGVAAPQVGVELRITRIEAKAKLSQNRPAADIDGVVTGVGGRGDVAMADAVQAARASGSRHSSS